MNELLKRIYAELNITENHLSANKLARCKQAYLHDLEVVDIDFDGRPFILAIPAAVAWRNMQQVAKSDGIFLEAYSGFRSYIYQKQLIARKLEKGRPLEAILQETAIPGFSEHHSGCAVDIVTDAKYELLEHFDQTEAFKWLGENAGRFAFQLSYPRNNTKGIIYEPWHWCFS